MGIQNPVEIAVVWVVVITGIPLKPSLLEQVAAHHPGQLFRRQPLRGALTHGIGKFVQGSQMLRYIQFGVFLASDKQCGLPQVQIFLRAGYHAGEFFAKAVGLGHASAWIIHLSACRYGWETEPAPVCSNG